MFFRDDRAFWCSAVVAWALIALLALGGWWPEADGWLAFFERWAAMTATAYSLHALAYITILAALERAAATAAAAVKGGSE